MTTQTDAAGDARPRLRRHVVATVIGNALEFYDFTTYAFFAAPIGQAFFPGRSPFEQLMLSLATFGVGFVSRPIGAVIIGRYGDRAGRRPAMVVSFALMGLAMLALGLTPSYARIGLLAPAIVVAARLLQGFALGGEFGPTSAYLLEAAPAGARGLHSAWQGASQGLAILLAGLIGLALSVLLGPAALQAWGWRIAFLLGAAALPFGLILRTSLPETLSTTPRAAVDRQAVKRPGAGYRRTLALGFVMVMSATTLTYVLTYMTTYASASLHLHTNIAFTATVVGGACSLAACLAGGRMSDRFGRKSLMVWPRVLLLLAIYPAFQLIARFHDAAALLGATAVLAILGSLSAAAALAWFTEALPMRLRSASLGIVYTGAVTLFGGTTQLVVTWLIHLSGDIRAPAFYLIVTTALGILAAVLAGETAPIAASMEPSTA